MAKELDGAYKGILSLFFSSEKKMSILAGSIEQITYMPAH
jgi:hypothetical protein